MRFPLLPDGVLSKTLIPMERKLWTPGIIPNVIVKKTIKDLLSGKDVVKEQALKILIGEQSPFKHTQYSPA